jgi:hypothetical protein
MRLWWRFAPSSGGFAMMDDEGALDAVSGEGSGAGAPSPAAS